MFLQTHLALEEAPRSLPRRSMIESGHAKAYFDVSLQDLFVLRTTIIIRWHPLHNTRLQYPTCASRIGLMGYFYQRTEVPEAEGEGFTVFSQRGGIDRKQHEEIVFLQCIDDRPLR